MPYTPEEFAAQIKAKYPQYASWPTDHLVSEVVSKHPEYSKWLAPQSVAQQAAASMNNRANGGDLPKGYTNDSLDQTTAQNFATDTPLGQRLVGAGMGMANTSRHVASFVQGAATGDFGPLADPVPEMKPTTTPQKQGYGAEQIGEYFIPGAAGLKVSSKLPLLARAAAEGATAAGVAGAQGGDPVVTGAAAAATPLAGAALKKAAPWMMDTFLGVKPGNLSTGAEPGQAVLDNGVFGATAKQYLKSIGEAKGRAMAKLNTALGRVSNATIDASGLVTAPLDAAAQTASAFPEQKAILQGIKQQIADEAQANGWDLSKLTPAQTNALRVRVNQIANASKGDQSVPQAIQDALFRVKYGLNNAIDQSAPGAKALNRTYGSLEEAEQAYRAKTNAGRGHFWDYVAAMPAVANLIHGEPLTALKTMLTGLAVKQAVTNPAAISGAGHVMYQGGKALSSEIAPKVVGGVTGLESQDQQ